MEETPSPAPAKRGRPGRKPKAKPVETPAKNESKKDIENEEKNDSTENVDESTPKAEKPEKLSLTERKQAKKAAIDAIIASGGRGKRTPKPNPKYMDEPVVSASKHTKDEYGDSENAEGEDGDDEMQSSDEPRHEGPLKKRMLQKAGIRPGPGRKSYGGLKVTPSNAGRKAIGSVPAKRKIIDVDIDIDDDHGKQLFLAAKRRLTNSPSNSDDDMHMRKGKNSVTDVLAAKLRAKFPDTIKRTLVTGDTKTIIVNRTRVMEKNKAAIQKIEDVDALHAKRRRADDTETSEDDSVLIREASDQEASSPKNNRRKTQHTKILSDDKIIRASAAGGMVIAGRKSVPFNAASKQSNKSPLTQNRLAQLTATKTYSISPQARAAAANKPAILRPPPRILNSTLCKPTNKATVPSHTLVTKLVTKDDYESDLSKKRNNNIISSRSKENVTSYTYTEKDGKMIPKKTVVQLSPQQKLLQQQKLAQQRKSAGSTLPVVRGQQHQTKIISTSEPIKSMASSKRIRKITCFETWYVIKMSEAQAKQEKSTLGLSLMQIGNEIKKIELPSSDWTYKILLQPLSKQMLAARQAKANQQPAKEEKVEVKAEKSDKEDDAKKDESGKKADDSTNSNDDAKEETKSEKTEPKEENGSDDKDEKKPNADEVKDEKSEAESSLHDIYTGEVHDSNIKEEERQNYRPINIMFRRKCQNPNIRIQFDRTVILKNQTYYLNIDGKNVKLVAAPQSIETYDDIKSLLQVVNDVSLNSCCVELATHIV